MSWSWVAFRSHLSSIKFKLTGLHRKPFYPMCRFTGPLFICFLCDWISNAGYSTRVLGLIGKCVTSFAYVGDGALVCLEAKENFKCGSLAVVYLLIFMCVCIHVHLCVCMFIYVGVRVCRPKLAIRVSSVSPPYILRQSLCLRPRTC